MEEPISHNIVLNDSNLSLQLIAQQPEIRTPIGIAIDKDDAIYILESHTHTPPNDYEGPKFDRIKKSIDHDGDGIPEEWTIFADSITDGMNLYHSPKYGLYLTTKMGVYLYEDHDQDGIGEIKKNVVWMTRPKNVYDHAGILGIAMDRDGWLYVSRGNVGSGAWIIKGTDGSQIEGYGDGGNVFRCKPDGSELEEIATGFWNPFDLKFSSEGRLFVTDNDPDSRGPNRLIEIVPGGDYGYKSVYGGSGIHPFSAWNGELPGTLPFAVPLGEAPCAMIDAGYTNFGLPYAGHMLVNIWEENNMVQIPLSETGSTVHGKPQVLLQGDKLFHPVALATNSKGDLYMTDWVLREYPNHGSGRLWRINSKKNPPQNPEKSQASKNRFVPDSRNLEELLIDLEKKDVFELAITRRSLAKIAGLNDLLPVLRHANPHLRLQGLLTISKLDERLDKEHLLILLADENFDVQRTTMRYIAEKGVTEMEPHLVLALEQNQIPPRLFETFLATIRHLQPAFLQGMDKRSGRSSSIPRKLPQSFISNILKNPAVDEGIKAVALPYLIDFKANETLIVQLLENSQNEKLQIALIKSLQKIPGTDSGLLLKNIAFNGKFASGARSMAVQQLGFIPDKYFKEVLELLKEDDESLQYVAVKYFCDSAPEESIKLEVQRWMEVQENRISTRVRSAWEACQKGTADAFDKEVYRSVKGNGNAKIGELVFANKMRLCASCHKIEGWGGALGPELSNIGSSKSKRQLIAAILEPSLEISPEWQGWYLVDAEGARHTGRQIDVHLNYAELMNANGEYDTFKNPKSYGVMDSSLMPEGLERTMTPLEFNDLITYLSQLK